MIEHSRFLTIKLLILISPFLLGGCFATPNLEGLTSEIKNDLGYKIELHESQAATTDSLPILFNLVFDQKVNLKTFKPNNIINSGKAGKINFEIINSGDNKNFTIKVHSVSSIGSIIPKLDLKGIYLDKGILKKEYSLVQVDYQPSSGLFKALDQFQPVDLIGHFKPIGKYNGKVIFLKGAELYSTGTEFGSEEMLSDGTGATGGYHHTIVGDKVFFLDMAMDGVSGSYIPVAFDLKTRSLNHLGIIKSSGMTMYKKLGCSSACGITSTFDKAYVFFPFDENRVIFNADDGTDAAVFISDGTVAGTQKIKAIQSTGNLDTYYYGRVGNNIYFAQDMNGGYHRELFVTDGTSAGTKQITGASIDFHTSGWDNMVAGNRFYFENDLDGRKAWYVIGDAPAVKETNFDVIAPYFEFNGKVYASKNKELVRMDPDGSNFEVLTSGFNWFYDPVISSGVIYFIANKTYNSANQFLWKYDPSDSSISQMTSYRTNYVDRIGDTLILEIDDPATGRELYSLSSSEVLTLLKDISPGTDDVSRGYNFKLNGKLFIYLNKDLWVSDGTPAGTRLHTDLPDWADTSPKYVALDGGLLIEHSDFDHHNDLFYFDGNSFLKVSELATGYSDLNTRIRGIDGDKIAFSLNDRRYGDQLWFSDGTLEGTHHYGQKSDIFKIGSKSYVFAESKIHSGINALYETDFTKSGTTESNLDIGKNASLNNSYFKSIVKTKDYEFFISYSSVDDNYALFSARLDSGLIERLISVDNQYFEYKVEGDNTVLIQAAHKLYYTEGTATTTYKLTPDHYFHGELTAFRLFGTDIYYSSYNKIYKASIGTDTAVEVLNTTNSAHTGTDIGYIDMLGTNLIYSSGWVDWTWYKSDTTSFGGVKLHDFSSGPDEEVDRDYSRYNIENHKIGDKVLFANPENEIWLSDGDSTHTKIGNGTAYWNVIKSGGKLLIFTSAGLITTDGTTTSTPDASFRAISVDSKIQIDDDKYLLSIDNYTTNDLYLVDAGVVSHYGTLPKQSSFSQDAYFFEKSGDYIFFKYSTAETGTELWGLNLVTKKYAPLSEIGEGNISSNPQQIYLGDTKLYMVSSISYKNDMIWAGPLSEIKQKIDDSPNTVP